MNYKEINMKTYDRYAHEFQERTKDYLPNIINDANEFVSGLRGLEPVILDLGSGPGRDSMFFRSKGYRVVSFDISREMLRLCKEKELKTIQGDLENLPFLNNTFHGVWAYTSLLNIPKKKFPYALNEIRRVLKNEGGFYIGMKEGRFEGELESDKYPGCKRFFSLYEANELEAYLAEHFEIERKSWLTLGDAVFLNYLCRAVH